MFNIDIVKSKDANDHPEIMDLTFVIKNDNVRNWEKDFMDDMIDFGFQYNSLLDCHTFRVDNIEDYNAVFDLLCVDKININFKFRVERDPGS